MHRYFSVDIICTETWTGFLRITRFLYIPPLSNTTINTFTQVDLAMAFFKKCFGQSLNSVQYIILCLLVYISIPELCLHQVKLQVK